jgi:rubredoxin
MRQRLAAGSAMHSRLGAASPAALLSPDLMRMVFDRRQRLSSQGLLCEADVLPSPDRTWPSPERMAWTVATFEACGLPHRGIAGGTSVEHRPECIECPECGESLFSWTCQFCHITECTTYFGPPEPPLPETACSHCGETYAALEGAPTAAVSSTSALPPDKARKPRLASLPTGSPPSSAAAASSAGAAPPDPPHEARELPRLAQPQTDPRLAALLEHALAQPVSDQGAAECEAAFRGMLEIDPDNFRALSELGAMSMGPDVLKPDGVRDDAWLAPGLL